MNNIALWGQTNAGMSLDDLLKTVQDAHIVNDGGRLCGGALELARIDNFPLFGCHFSVIFYFDKNELCQVTIERTDDTPHGDNTIMFNNVFTALLAKYGSTLSRFDSEYSTEANWLNGKTNILLYLSKDEQSTLKVVYQHLLYKEVSKL